MLVSANRKLIGPEKSYRNMAPVSGKPIWLPKTDLPRSKTKSYNLPIGSHAEKEVIQ
jgi:hypothetical protein